MKKSLIILAVLFITAALLSADDSVLEATKKKYKPKNWPGKNNPLKAGCPLGEMKAEGFKGSKVENLPPQPARKDFSKEDKPAFNTSVEVCDSVEKAHQKLLEFLVGISIDVKMPTLTENGHNIGDIGFICENEKSVAWIAFARNNVFIVLRRTAKDREMQIDLVKAAKSIDGSTNDQSNVESLKKPEIPTFATPKNPMKLRDKIALDIKTVDDADLHFEVLGTGQGYVEKGKDEKYYFKATGAGTVKIKLTVTNKLCNRSSKEIEFKVAK